MDAELYTQAVVDRQVWELLMNLLDQFYALLGGRRPTLKETAALISGALDRAVLSALPEEEEGVAVGRIGHMLPGRTEALVLPGMNDGVMTPGGTSLLSDAERRALKDATGRTVGVDQGKMGMIVRSDYYRTMTLPERRLSVSWCLRDESGSALLPGEPVFELRRLFPALREEGGLRPEDPPCAPATPSLALEEIGPLLREVRAGDRDALPDGWDGVLRALSRDVSAAPTLLEMLSRTVSDRPAARIAPATALRLFHGQRVSISRLECCAGCPRQHFMRYGLRPAQPEEFEFSAGDAGNFFHEALRRYLDEAVRDPGWPRLDDRRVDQLMDGILDDLTLPWEEGPLREDAAGRWQGESYLRRVRRAASVLTRSAANSDFKVLGTEMEFGTPQGMPPVILSLPDGSRVALQGKIDRLDRYRGPDGDYLRVLDLKSSAKQLDPARMDRGEQLQLMIYLAAALQARPGSLPAGALYFPVQDREVRADTPEQAEERRMKEVQLRGVVLAEEDVLRAMDREISPFSLPKVLNQDGSISRTVGWALPPETLRNLMDAARTRAEELCVRIRSGEVSASPSVSDDRSACTFCEFQSVCRRRKSDERPLPKGITFADVGRPTDK